MKESNAAPAAAACLPSADGSCSICADEAIPGTVLSVDGVSGTAEVDFPTGIATVALDLVDSVSPGDGVMVHLGFAIARVSTHD